MDRREALGAELREDGCCCFRIWAPLAEQVELHLLGDNDRLLPMAKDDHGYHHLPVDGIKAGQRYTFRINGKDERPDPISRFQPEGVHGPSEVVDSLFPWTDAAWHGLPLADYIIYELHVGAFSPAGTFEGAIPYLDELRDLGVTAIELMPVAQFPGERNWGYDGVFPFAPQHSYGGPEGLRKLIDACHAKGMAVIIDAVYNHLGPEGNYFWGLAPYFTDKYRTPWGQAVNVDDAGSRDVRRMFTKNALYWLTDFHADALRLDAIHAIYDFSARPFLMELAELVHQRAAKLGRQIHVIGESDLNDVRVVKPWSHGGLGLDAAWSDDFHHAVHAYLTGERDGYYHDFGSFDDVAKAVASAYVYDGKYSAFRGRAHGNATKGVPYERFVICTQNHDQVGNRMTGERLGTLVKSFEKQKMAAGLMLLSPYTPLLFMGEEYGEPAPFQYFIHHSDEKLVEAVRKGRREEFKAFKQGDPPDPQSVETFQASKLDHQLKTQGAHRTLWQFYRELIRKRKTLGAIRHAPQEARRISHQDQTLIVHIRQGVSQLFMAFNLGDKPAHLESAFPIGRWEKEFDSSDPRWCVDAPSNGKAPPEPSSLAPMAFAVYVLHAG